MEIIDLVSELLYDHNCVIVPGFGGFVANLKASEFNPESGIVRPSRKMVAFNQNLRENDGLLIQHVAKKLNVSYSTAEAKVNELVNHIWERLDQYKNFEFRNVGTIYQNKDRKLIFVPYENHNFYTSSYGLPGIKVRPVKALSTVKEKQSQKVRKMEPVVMQSTAVQGQSTSFSWRITGIAATLLFFLGASYLGYRFSEPFAEGTEIAATKANDSEALGSILSFPANDNKETTSGLTDPQSKDNNTMNKKAPVAVQQPEQVADNSVMPRQASEHHVTYHIIADEASTLTDAENLVQQESYNHFTPRFIEGQNASNVLISIESFSFKSIAEQYLEEILTHNFKDAYILEVSE